MEVTRKRCIAAPMVVIAGALGIVQGFAWSILSLVAILLYEKLILPTTSYDALLGQLLYQLYLDRDFSLANTTISTSSGKAALDISIIIGSKEFNYFMYFYLVFSFTLFVISIAVLWAVKTGRSEESSLWKWTQNMAILAILDFVLLCLIAHDYDQIKRITIPADSSQAMIAVTKTFILFCVGIVMTLSARGFILWIVNFAFIIIFGKYLYLLRKERQSDDGRTN